MGSCYLNRDFAMLTRGTSLIAAPCALVLVTGISIAYNAPRVERSLRDRIAVSLQNANVPMGELTVDGRDVLIGGFVGSREVGADATSAIRGTWGVRDVLVNYRPLPVRAKPVPAPELEARLNDIVRRRVIEFDHSREDLTPAGRSALAEVLSALIEYPSAKFGADIRISAVMDPKPPSDLGRKRAEAVKAYLVSKGVSPERFLQPRDGQPPTGRSEVLFFVEGASRQ